MKISVFKNCHWQNVVVLSLLVLLISVSTVFGMSDTSTGKKYSPYQPGPDFFSQPLPNESPSNPNNMLDIDYMLKNGMAVVERSGRILKKSCIKGISCTLEFNADIEYPNGCEGRTPKSGGCYTHLTYGKLRLSKLPPSGSYSVQSPARIFIDSNGKTGSRELYFIK